MVESRLKAALRPMVGSRLTGASVRRKVELTPKFGSKLMVGVRPKAESNLMTGLRPKVGSRPTDGSMMAGSSLMAGLRRKVESTPKVGSSRMV
jgi:hypothetical protein